MNLLIALDAAGRPLTAVEIMERVPEYSDGQVPTDRPDFSAWPESMQLSARAAFEEDKRTLRKLGLELEVMERGSNSRYIVRRDKSKRLQLSLTAAETAIVQAAAQQWKNAGIQAATARRGVNKALGLGENPDSIDNSFLGRIVPDSPCFDDLMDAYAHQTVVEFEYRRRDSFVPQTRRVHPWHLTLRDSRWYLRGFDELRGAERIFLLKRIVSGIRPLPELAYRSPIDAESRPSSDSNSDSSQGHQDYARSSSDRLLDLDQLLTNHGSVRSQNGKN